LIKSKSLIDCSVRAEGRDTGHGLASQLFVNVSTRRRHSHVVTAAGSYLSGQASPAAGQGQ